MADARALTGCGRADWSAPAGDKRESSDILVSGERLNLRAIDQLPMLRRCLRRLSACRQLRSMVVGIRRRWKARAGPCTEREPALAQFLTEKFRRRTGSRLFAAE